MAYLYLDNAQSTALAPRDIDGDSLVIQSADATKFGAPSSGTPLRVGVFEASTDALKGVLEITNRTGNVLKVSQAGAGYADVAVAIGDIIAAVPLAADFTGFQSSIDAKVDASALSEYYDSTAVDALLATKQDALPAPSSGMGKALASNGSAYVLIDVVRPSQLADYATTAAVDLLEGQLAGKEPALPDGGTTSTWLRGDKTWAPLPSTDLSNYYDKSQIDTSLAGKEPTITAGTSSQYIKGNKALGTFSADVIASLPSQSGNTGKVLQTDGTNLLWATPSGGGGIPGGSSGQIQYNNAGAFDGSSSLVFDATNKRLGISAATPESTLDLQANASEDLVTLRNSGGTPLVKVLHNGGFTPRKIRFVLGRYVDLVAGTNLALPGIADYAGTITKLQILPGANPSGGGFSIDLKKNGSSIFSSAQAVAANTTALQTITTFNTTSVSAGDLFTIDASSVGTGVQNIIVELTYLSRNQ